MLEEARMRFKKSFAVRREAAHHQRGPFNWTLNPLIYPSLLSFEGEFMFINT